jgi:hypothetical protein
MIWVFLDGFKEYRENGLIKAEHVNMGSTIYLFNYLQACCDLKRLGSQPDTLSLDGLSICFIR